MKAFRAYTTGKLSAAPSERSISAQICAPALPRRRSCSMQIVEVPGCQVVTRNDQIRLCRERSQSLNDLNGARPW